MTDAMIYYPTELETGQVSATLTVYQNPNRECRVCDIETNEMICFLCNSPTKEKYYHTSNFHDDCCDYEYGTI